MWVEKTNSKTKGTRYKFYERFPASNGKIIKVSVTFSSNNAHTRKAAADALRQKFFKKEGLRKEAEQEMEEKTFYAVCDEWFAMHAQTIKESTAYIESLWVRKIKSAVLPSFLIGDLEAEFIGRFLTENYYTGKYSFSYVTSVLTTFKKIMKYAAQKGYIDDVADFLAIKLHRRPLTTQELEKKNQKFLSRDELHDVLDKLYKKSPRVAYAMEFIAHTGLRCGELLALRWQDVDLKEKSITINGTIVHLFKNDDDRKRNTPKNIYSYRTLALDNRSIKILQWFQADNNRLRLWKHTYTDRGYIFTAKTGVPMDIAAINRQLQAINYKKHLTTHIFRHTHVSLLAEAGVPLKAIMQRVGHHNPQTTLSIYTHVTTNMQNEVVEKLDCMSL